MKEKKKFFTLICVILFVIICTFLFIFNKNDGMENRGIKKISYRIYTKENGWSNWCKNGLTCGNKKNKILNIQIKTPTNNMSYSVYNSNQTWIRDLTSIDNIKNKTINGMSFNIYRELNSKYDICYRSYNKKNSWLGWTCNGQTSGNSKYPVTAIEIKIVPKNVAKYDYLKDYNSSYTGSINFNGR